MILGTSTQVDPGFNLQLLLTVGLYASLASQLIPLFRGKGAKREVAMAEEYVTKDQCSLASSQIKQRIETVERDVREIRAELKADRENLQKTLLTEVGKVHDRVDQVLEAVSELRGELNAKR